MALLSHCTHQVWALLHANGTSCSYPTHQIAELSPMSWPQAAAMDVSYAVGQQSPLTRRLSTINSIVTANRRQAPANRCCFLGACHFSPHTLVWSTRQNALNPGSRVPCWAWATCTLKNAPEQPPRPFFSAGCWASYVAAEEAQLLKVPASIPVEYASTFVVGPMVAYRMLKASGLKSGKCVVSSSLLACLLASCGNPQGNWTVHFRGGGGGGGGGVCVCRCLRACAQCPVPACSFGLKGLRLWLFLPAIFL